MAQRSERLAKLPERKIGLRGLQTLKQVTSEMRRVYISARHGTFDGGWPAAGTAIRCLERLRYAVASSDLEARLEVLEERLDVKPRPNGYRREHFIDDDDDDEDEDRFEELRQ
jgi:hypothetical protein